jgi:hypothetical protein
MHRAARLMPTASPSKAAASPPSKPAAPPPSKPTKEKEKEKPKPEHGSA